ncbi:MAG: ABC transporter ATP-binding protein/permease [Lachnospiraceae bacterium]|nr:ABC transporter ATP-binding protein/permease [Lachnospiraceae bacterium]
MKKTYILYRKTFALLWKQHPGLIICNLLSTVLSTAFPYVNLVLAARLIDGLAGRQTSVLVQAVLTLTLANLLYQSILSVIEKQLAIENSRFLTTQNRLIAEKSARVCYETFLSDSFQNQKRRIYELTDENDVKLSSVIEMMNSVIGCAVSILSAAAALCGSGINVTLTDTWAAIVAAVVVLANAVLVAGSMRRSFRLLAHRKTYHTQILPLYKIGWYLDREYLRFTKTAKEVRIFRQDGIILKLIDDANAQKYGKSLAYEKKAAAVNGAGQVCKQISNCLIYLFTGLLALRGMITVGVFTSFSGILKRFYDSCVAIGEATVRNQDVVLWLDAFWEHLEQEDGAEDGHGAVNGGIIRDEAGNKVMRRAEACDDEASAAVGSVPGQEMEESTSTCTDAPTGSDILTGECSQDTAVVARNVDFSYGKGAEEFGIRTLNLTIRKGEHVAVVGRNGSGKSTLIMLLCGLLRPQKGTILVNGTAHTDENGFAGISTVFQDFCLFALPIKENIAACASPDMQKVWESVRFAGLPDRFCELLDSSLFRQLDPNGIEASGGEMQKIAIARARYQDEPIFIMDEPTSSLDPLSESVIYENIHTLLRDSTVIFISHRLSSCKFCDRILVMEEGNIIQQGRHEELLQDEGGRYAALWNAQARYYQGGDKPKAG